LPRAVGDNSDLLAAIRRGHFGFPGSGLELGLPVHFFEGSVNDGLGLVLILGEQDAGSGEVQNSTKY
jgi:hypothetical protein